jgi:methyl-accepting chemotaxis protein
MKSLRSLFAAALVSVALAAGLLLVSILNSRHAAGEVSAAEERRFLSALLADELRQSSDDLTRLARTYVVSGDPVWEQQYFEVLDIRNGKKPRPAGYERIYWDFRAAGATPSGPGHNGAATTDSLLARMKTAGFTEAEFAKLKEAAGNSDDLVKTETVAMNLVKGLHADEQGGFTKKGSPDTARAAAMMHDADYHRFKAKIMKPVDEFLVMLDARTLDATAAAAAKRQGWSVMVTASTAILIALAVGWLRYAQVWVRRRLGAEPDEVVQAVNRLSEGDLTARPQCRTGDEQSVMGALGRTIAAFSQSVAQVRREARNVQAASVDVASGNAEISQRTEQQSGTLQQTAASMEQLGTTVQENAHNAMQANQLAMSASDVATRGGEVVGQFVETMKGINDSSRKIADIISVIDSIAFQTNILALNAAVEAARAGEQGRGFAVVASEVRNLAQRSAEAAREIKSLIGASVERVERGATLVDQAGETMDEVVSAIKRVTEIVGAISVASGQQSTGVAQIGHAVAQIDSMTQQNAALVEQSAAAAATLRERSGMLVAAVAAFKLAEAADDASPRLAV